MDAISAALKECGHNVSIAKTSITKMVPSYVTNTIGKVPHPRRPTKSHAKAANASVMNSDTMTTLNLPTYHFRPSVLCTLGKHPLDFNRHCPAFRAGEKPHRDVHPSGIHMLAAFQKSCCQMCACLHRPVICIFGRIGRCCRTIVHDQQVRRQDQSWDSVSTMTRIHLQCQ